MAIKDVSVGEKKTANNDDTMREWMSRGKRGSPSRTFRLSAYRRLVQSKFGGPTGKKKEKMRCTVFFFKFPWGSG
jgi:hypothetical protein